MEIRSELFVLHREIELLGVEDDLLAAILSLGEGRCSDVVVGVLEKVLELRMLRYECLQCSSRWESRVVREVLAGFGRELLVVYGAAYLRLLFF